MLLDYFQTREVFSNFKTNLLEIHLADVIYRFDYAFYFNNIICIFKKKCNFSVYKKKCTQNVFLKYIVHP